MTDEEGNRPPPGAIPLYDALRHFLPSEMWDKHAHAAEAKTKLPKRPSYFSMSGRDWQDAREASQRMRPAQSARIDLQNAWNVILAAMKLKFETGELTAFGQDNPPFGPWLAIPVQACRTMSITNVEKGVARVGSAAIYDIYVLPSVDDDHMPTGMPGRKSKGAAVIKTEFFRRVEAKELEISLAAQSRSLADWYRGVYPMRDCPTPESIENNLRSDFRNAIQT